MSAVFRWMILRRLAGERARTLLALAGVALGVAVFVAIRLASHSALASFADTVDAVAGRANLSVWSTSDGFDERLYPRLLRVAGVEAAAPIVQVAAHAKPRAPRPDDPATLAAGERGPYVENVLVLGLDPLVEAPFARWRPPRAEPGGGGGPRAAFLRLLAEPGTVAVTRTLARRHGLAAGDTLTVLASGEPTPLVIVQALESEELQQAMGGNVVIADIATVQEVFHRAGRLDRVDLVVDPARRDEVQDAIARALPADAAVGLPQGRTKQVENMVAAFRLNLTALSFIAVFVSTFLILNAVAMSVLRWRREIGILRGLGATRGEVRALFLGEGALLGVVGGALGLALGTVLAGGALHAVGRTLSDLYMLQYTDRLRGDLATYAAGFAISAASSLLSALGPAIEASLTPPGVTMRQGQMIEAQRPPLGSLALAGAATLVAAALVAYWTVREHQAWGGFLSAFLVLAGFSLLAPGFTLAGERLLRGAAARLAGIEGRLGSRYLRESVARASVVVAALMVAVGMMVALNVMVASFRRTVDTWIGQSLRGDLYVEPAGHRASLGATALPESLLAATRRIPGVAGVDSYRATPLTYGDRMAMAVGIDFDVHRRFGSLQFVGGARSAEILSRALEGGGVLVTESFSHRHRVSPGDTLALATPAGPERLRVEGVFFDYSSDAGAVLMDRQLFARLWRDERTESLALYLAPGASADSVRTAFLALAGTRLFHVTPHRALRARALQVFDQTFQITFALQAIAVLVALLGVVSTLTALILQRGREIGVLRATGALRGQVRAIVLVESGMLGLIGSALGCAAGLVLALLLVHVINRQFFGWTIRFEAEPWVFAQAVALVVATALVAGLGPARLASGRAAAEAMRTD